MEQFPFGNELYLRNTGNTYQTNLEWIKTECYDYILKNELYKGEERIKIKIKSISTNRSQKILNEVVKFGESSVNVSFVYDESVNRMEFYSVTLVYYNRKRRNVFRLPGWVFLPKYKLAIIISTYLITDEIENRYHNIYFARETTDSAEMVYQIMTIYMIFAFFGLFVKSYKGIYTVDFIKNCEKIIEKIEETKDEFGVKFIHSIFDRNGFPPGVSSFKEYYRYLFYMYNLNL